jgi:class 3 adenylate cyclase
MNDQRAQRRLAAILAADVVGYSRLVGVDEEGTLAKLRVLRREVVDPMIKEHRGRIVRITGDGLLVEFASVVDAVRCAVDTQREMALRNTEVPVDQRIEFRIGINLGDIMNDEEDIYGDGVNVAARLEALAPPRGICVSRVVRDQVRDKLNFSFDDRGEQQVQEYRAASPGIRCEDRWRDHNTDLVLRASLPVVSVRSDANTGCAAGCRLRVRTSAGFCSVKQRQLCGMKRGSRRQVWAYAPKPFLCC